MDEKPPEKPRERGVAADRPPMIRSRAIPAIGAGVLALGGALLAIVTETSWLVVVAAAFALLSAGMVIDWHRRSQAREAARAELSRETAALAEETDAALARAARFEAEAIQARAELAEAMTSRRAVGAADAEFGLGHPDRPPLPAQPDVITDAETGLFSQVFFDASLVKRISAARRGLRPLSVAIADVVLDVGTDAVAPAPSKPVADTMLAVFREADTLARSGDGLYLILLEDTPENGAIWTLERLRRKIAEDLPGHTLWVGLSCYPAFGFDADQLVIQARGALTSAREWHQDRIEVTTAAPD